MVKLQQDWDETRRRLFTAIQEQGFKLNNLSKAMGKNTSYLQQYFNRGTPKELDDRGIRMLCQLLSLEYPLGALVESPTDERVDVAMLEDLGDALMFNRKVVVQRVKRVPDFLSQPMAFAVFMPHNRLKDSIPVSSLLYVDHVLPPRRDDRVFVEVEKKRAYVGIYHNDTDSSYVITIDSEGKQEEIPKNHVRSIRKITYIKFP